MRALALTSLALLVAAPAFAQQWTAEQQEIIDFTNDITSPRVLRILRRRRGRCWWSTHRRLESIAS